MRALSRRNVLLSSEGRAREEGEGGARPGNQRVEVVEVPWFWRTAALLEPPVLRSPVILDTPACIDLREKGSVGGGEKLERKCVCLVPPLFLPSQARLSVNACKKPPGVENACKHSCKPGVLSQTCLHL